MPNRSADRTARTQRLIVISLIGLALGFLIVIQLRSQAAVARTLAAQDDTSVALLINDLNHATNQLIQQSAALSQQEAQLRQAPTPGGSGSQAPRQGRPTRRGASAEAPVRGAGLP